MREKKRGGVEKNPIFYVTSLWTTPSNENSAKPGEKFVPTQGINLISEPPPT